MLHNFQNAKKLLSVFLTILMTLGLAVPSFALPNAVEVTDTVADTAIAQEDNGAELSATEYYIYTAEDMNNVRNDLAGTYYLMNDIDLSVYEDWEPIGNYSIQFTGIFDGQGYTIRNITTSGYTSDSANNHYIGLFGISSGTIKNLNIVNFNFVNDDSNTYTHYIGAVVGVHYYGTVSNCSFDGTIIGRDTTGGIAGYNNQGIISDCRNFGDITSITSDNVSFAAGIAGCNNGIIIRCYNEGAMTAGGRAGGITGFNEDGGEISNCYNTGDILSGSSYRAGGIASGNLRGTLPGTITNCYSTGNVSGKEGSGAVIGATSAADGASATNLYFNSDTGLTDTFATGLTTEQMKSAESFVGFDFENIWAIDENINNGMPYLQSLGAADTSNSKNLPQTRLNVHSIKTTSPTGLRFMAEVSSEHTASVIGWIITTEDKLDAAGIDKADFTLESNVKKVEGKNYNIEDGTNIIFSSENNIDVVSAVLSGILPKDYMTVLVARPYSIDDEGTHYGEAYAMCTRDVAQIMKDDAAFDAFSQEQKDVINAILEGSTV